MDFFGCMRRSGKKERTTIEMEIGDWRRDEGCWRSRHEGLPISACGPKEWFVCPETPRVRDAQSPQSFCNLFQVPLCSSLALNTRRR